MEPQPASALGFSIVFDPQALAQMITQLATEFLWKLQDWIAAAKQYVNDRLENQKIIDAARGNAQAEIDAADRRAAAQTAAEYAADATISPTSTACATSGLLQAENGLDDIVLKLTDAYMALAYRRGIIPNTGANGAQSIPTPPTAHSVCRRVGRQYTFLPSSAQNQQTITACLSGESKGAAAAGGNCAPASKDYYANADLDTDTIFRHPQLRFPQQVTKQTDFYLSFPDAVPCSDTPSRDEVLFAAAILRCDNGAPLEADPTANINSNDKPSVAQINAEGAYLLRTAPTASALRECIWDVFKRTACPNAASDSLKSSLGGVDCFGQQYQVCHLLKDKPPYGHNINHTGNFEIDSALKDCDTYGLSWEMSRAVWAHRCSDPAFVENIAGGTGKIADLERETSGKCQEDPDRYEEKVQKSKEELMNKFSKVPGTVGQ